MTLTDFLLARIAEQEKWANWAQEPWQELRTPSTWQVDVGFTPARVIAECEAKRRIVASVQRALPRGTGGLGPSILRHLALPYANHPDYRDEWRP